MFPCFRKQQLLLVKILFSSMECDRGDSFPFKFNGMRLFRQFPFQIKWIVIVLAVFLSIWKKYDRGDSCPSDFESNGVESNLEIYFFPIVRNRPKILSQQQHTQIWRRLINIVDNNLINYYCRQCNPWLRVGTYPRCALPDFPSVSSLAISILLSSNNNILGYFNRIVSSMIVKMHDWK